MRLIKLLGSLPIAVFLITALTVILIVSTAMESAHGTPFVQNAFYQAKWFDLFLGLIWVNIFCATLSRWPFKKRHAGFIITHIGILTLLIGTLITRLSGAEGQMTLLEGEQWDRIQQTGSDLLAAPQQGPAYQFRLPDGGAGKPHRLKVPDSALELYFHERSTSVGTRLVVKNRNEFYNPAVRFTLSSERVGVRQELWLIARDPENAFSDETELGPARFRIEDAEEAAWARENAAKRPEDKPARLVISDKSGRPIGSIDLPAEPDMKHEIGKGFTVTALRYLPYARVFENRLIDDTGRDGGKKWNPAVEFTVRGADGTEEKHTRFAMFPEFDSLHGKDTPNVFDLKVELRASVPDELKGEDAKGPELVFEARENGEWTWRSARSDGTERAGKAVKGAEFETGWMDMKVRVDRVVPKAEVTRSVGPLPEGAENAETGARVSYTGADGKKREDWILMSRPLEIGTPAGRWTLSLTDRSLKLPFTLQLKDFRKVDYPGTSNPASFESDVILFDKAKDVRIERTIKMNEPLDYAGWRIFQSSYIQDPQFGEASVFTIARNPGITATYAGCVILLIGVITLFYIKPFGSGQHVH
jgi:hypothetical protein